jgi:hypothetical protein
LLTESINVAIAKALYIEIAENIKSANVSRNAISEYLGNSSKTSSLSCLYMGLFQLHSRNFSYVISLIEGILSNMTEYDSRLPRVLFSNPDNAYLPNFLILEQIIKGKKCCTAIDQYVLAYLLIFLSYHHLGCEDKCNHVIQTLSEMVNNTCIDYKQCFATHLNCLGYCYLLLGNDVSAFDTFCRSLQSLPSVVNGASYHMACMINKKISTRS